MAKPIFTNDAGAGRENSPAQPETISATGDSTPDTARVTEIITSNGELATDLPAWDLKPPQDIVARRVRLSR